MPLTERLRGLLDSRQIPYSLTHHRAAIRASELAHVEHLPAWEVAKTVVVLGDEHFLIVVVPADRQVDLQEVRSALNLKEIRLATEQELVDLFPDCELGAMPPIGILYHLPVYLDADLANETMITFNAGTHQECVHMRISDFRKLTQPHVVSITRFQTAGYGW
jgi:Ala-tRNA(Pro) deacylase